MVAQEYLSCVNANGLDSLEFEHRERLQFMGLIPAAFLHEQGTLKIKRKRFEITL